jgi:hypothetical protein
VGINGRQCRQQPFALNLLLKASEYSQEFLPGVTENLDPLAHTGDDDIQALFGPEVFETGHNCISSEYCGRFGEAMIGIHEDVQNCVWRPIVRQINLPLRSAGEI